MLYVSIPILSPFFNTYLLFKFTIYLYHLIFIYYMYLSVNSPEQYWNTQAPCPLRPSSSTPRTWALSPLGVLAKGLGYMRLVGVCLALVIFLV